MASSAAKGAYYKSKTRKYLAARGYEVIDLEVVKWIFTAKGKIPIKRDQMASDLQAVSASEIIFVQVKGGLKCDIGRARSEFSKFTYPPFSKQWILFWKLRAREPRVIDVTSEAL